MIELADNSEILIENQLIKEERKTMIENCRTFCVIFL